MFESRIDTYWELVQATSPQFGDWYFFLLQLLSMATFILAATIAISLVTRQLMPVRIRIRSWFFKLFHPSGRVYIVSGFDSRSQIFVRSVLEGQGKPASLCIIANVDKETVEKSSSAVAYFKEQGALFTELSVSRLTSMLVVQAAEPHKRRLLYGLQIHYLYLNDEEKANLSEAVKFLGSLGSSLTGDMCFDSEGSPLFHVYIACHGQSDELLLDSIRSLYERSTDAASGGEATVLKGVDVRVLDEWRDIAFKLLWDHPLTEALTERGIEAARDLLHKKGQDEVGLTAIILGFGAHGFEVFRTISWFGQIPGVRLRIVVMDQRPKSKLQEEVLFRCPELLSSGLFDCEFIQVDITSPLFKTLIRKEMRTSSHSLSVPYIVVNTGDDNLNMDTAILVRQLAYEEEDQQGSLPLIFANIRDARRHPAIWSLVAKDQGSQSGSRYEIVPFGSIDSLFSEDFLIDSSMEALSFNINSSYAGIYAGTGDPYDRRELFRSYAKYQMNRLSSMTSAYSIQEKLWSLGFRLEERAGSAPEGTGKAELDAFLDSEEGSKAVEVLGRWEHRRWCAFYYSQGWTQMSPQQSRRYRELGLSGGRHDSHLLLKHPYLCDFDKLADVAAALGKSQSPAVYNYNLIRDLGDIVTDQRGYGKLHDYRICKD